MPNRLAGESSPYLLQHKDNPVDWYPWGEEALDRAKSENRPIFLSIGYSACHWCHVMEHESFEDDRIAQQLNEKFVCIKVDREERPDLDQIYMGAVQLLTRRGGWPMSVFLTPDLRPFFGGTYWPPRRSRGMPGFDEVIAKVDEAWRERQDQVVDQGDKLTTLLQQTEPAAGEWLPDRAFFQSVAEALKDKFDFEHGGFGSAPKFPHSMDLQLLLRIWRDTERADLLGMVRLNLDKMSQGGIHDHLAGGFARYSVDERWLVPHFEKMLYDNGLLSTIYLEAYQATGDELYAEVTRQTLDYILSYMTDAEGGFLSSEDADSEGVEGKFYVWDREEILTVLGAGLGAAFCDVFSVTEEGNFEGRNILHLSQRLSEWAKHGDDTEAFAREMHAAKASLLKVRDERIRPGRDDKVLMNWNALVIDAMARAGAILSEPAYLRAAEKGAAFLLGQLRRSDGRLLHCWRQGAAKGDAFLDDYAYFTNTLVALYESTFDERWLDEAIRVAELMLSHFHDAGAGGFFFTADDHEQLIARQKDFQDASVPSGNGMAAFVLFRLASLTGATAFREAALSTLRAGKPFVDRAPTAAGQLLLAAYRSSESHGEIVVVGGNVEAENTSVRAVLRKRFLPGYAIAYRAGNADVYRSDHLQRLFTDRPAIDGRVTMYVCREFACQAPVVGGEQIESALAEM